MYVQFPAMALFALAVALLAMTVLAWRNHRWAEQFCKDRDLAIRECRRKYAEGHADGLKLGLARGAGESETTAAKAWEEGYNRALVDMSQEMQVERGAEYHAISA